MKVPSIIFSALLISYSGSAHSQSSRNGIKLELGTVKVTDKYATVTYTVLATRNFKEVNLTCTVLDNFGTPLTVDESYEENIVAGEPVYGETVGIMDSARSASDLKASCRIVSAR